MQRHGKLLAALLLCSLASGCDRSNDAKQSIVSGEIAGPAPTEAARVVTAFAHDPQAFTQGLVFHDGTLLESTGGVGISTLRKISLSSGEVLQHVRLPAPHFGEGLAVLGDKAYQLTWQDRIGYIYDPATLQRLGSFSYDGEGWGLTTDGQSLILSDGTAVFRFLDPATFRVVRTLEVLDGRHPVRALNELEWVRGEIWANVWRQDRIARIDPKTGHVLAWLDLAGLAPPVRQQNIEAVPNGIAFDEKAGKLFVTGKLWPVLYEVQMPSDISPPIETR